MDIVLNIADDLVLDSLWARLVPLSAFSGSAAANASLYGSPLNSTSHTSLDFKSLTSSALSWPHLVSSLPHPPLPTVPLSTSELSSLSAWPRDYILRQMLSLTVITLLGIVVLYFLFAGLSYHFIFNHEMKKHPRFLKNQIRQEIMCSLRAFPGMTMLTLPCFLAEVRGWTKLYDNISDYGWGYYILSMPLFLLFTDYLIYWIHRWLHLPVLYKIFHKPHHKWIVPTPFASHAFHPVDGFAQSVPYHLFVFMFPLHRITYLILFVLINFWTILIHDSDMITGHPLEHVINGPAHHTLHHLYFTVNYGQYFTWADRAGGSYRHPAAELDPLLAVKMAEFDQQAESSESSSPEASPSEEFTESKKEQ